MNTLFKYYLYKLKTISIYKIPLKYRAEFIKEKMALNEDRESIICITLFILNIILLFVDIAMFKDKWDTLSGYKNLYYAHIVLFFGLTVYLILSKFQKNNTYRFRRILHLCIMLFVLSWCAAVSANAQLIHGQLSAYIIGVFTLASIIILDFKESLIVYSISFLLFYIIIHNLEISHQQFSGNVINASYILIIAFVVSRLSYFRFIKNFINKKIIDEKNVELDNSHKNLEKIVKLRTNDLLETIEQLVEEMRRRHEVELEIVKTKNLYEEKNILLEETKKYEKLRNNFFSNISHELRTPLNLIYSAQQMIDYNLKDDIKDINKEKLLKNSNIVKQNIYRLLRIINNLIDITKMDAGYFKVNFKNVDIIKLVEDITLSVVAYVENKNKKLTFDTELEEKIIACDPDKIERIVLNLISNAIKFTDKFGLIQVKIYSKKDKICLSIKDNGIGIPTNMKEMVFEKFIQVDKSTNRSKEGSGIGLSLVKSLVEMQNGTISLISETGKGCEFIIELPDYKISEKEKNEIENICHDEIIQKINVEFSDIYF